MQHLYPTVFASLQGGADPSEWVAAALQGPLMPAQQQRVLAALGGSPGAELDSLGLAPAALGRLVEHNPSIAIEVGLFIWQFRADGVVSPVLAWAW